MQHDEGVLAWAALLKAHAAALQRISEAVERQTRLPLSWYDVLLELNAAPARRLRMSELGEVVVLSRTRVSRIVDELGDAGLVRREPDPQDRRSAFAVLTPAGRQRLRRAAPVYLRAIRERFTRHLSTEELHALRTALDKVRQANEPPGR